MSSENSDFKIGDVCYLREDYEEQNISEEFNIQCEILDLKLVQIDLGENNIQKQAGKVVQVKRNDRDDPEWVTLDSIKKT